MPSAKVYTFDKGSEEYEILKYGISRKARRKLGVKFPMFGKNRNKVVIPENVYQLVVRFLVSALANPSLYMSDIIVKRNG